MADLDLIAKPPLRDAPAFVETETARAIIMSLNITLAMAPSAATFIAGAPGVGKTMALRHFADVTAGVHMVTAVKGEGQPYAFAQTLCGRFDVGHRGVGLFDMRRDLMAKLGQSARMLIVDEAQHLAADTLEWLRGLHDAAGLALALGGHLELAAAIGGHPQLDSRMVAPQRLVRVDDADVRALALLHGIADAASFKHLDKASRLPGRLRNVANVARLAALNVREGEPITADAVRSAAARLGLVAGVR